MKMTYQLCVMCSRCCSSLSACIFVVHNRVGCNKQWKLAVRLLILFCFTLLSGLEWGAESKGNGLWFFFCWTTKEAITAGDCLICFYQCSPLNDLEFHVLALLSLPWPHNYISIELHVPPLAKKKSVHSPEYALYVSRTLYDKLQAG